MSYSPFLLEGVTTSLDLRRRSRRRRSALRRTSLCAGVLLAVVGMGWLGEAGSPAIEQARSRYVGVTVALPDPKAPWPDRFERSGLSAALPKLGRAAPPHRLVDGTAQAVAPQLHLRHRDDACGPTYIALAE